MSFRLSGPSMHSFVSLHATTLCAPDGRVLLRDLTVSFGAERTGLVGPNGVGKSSLLAVMAGQVPPASGQVRRQGSIGSLRQTWPDLRVTVSAALGVQEAVACLNRIETGHYDQADLDAADWTLATRLSQALARVGLSDDMLMRPLSQLSGGQRTRLGLAQLWLTAPDLLLLDEPTNTLDADGRRLVSDLIAGWPGGVVVASHDRALLERMDRILALSPAGCSLHDGGWSAYAAAQAARDARNAASLARAERQVAQVDRAIQIRRERAARRARQGRAQRAAGSQPKVLLDARADRADRTGARDRRLDARLAARAEAVRAEAQAQIDIRAPLRIEASGARGHGAVLRLNGVQAQRGAFRLGPLDLVLMAGERLALDGANGAGKSTLFDLLRGDLAPLGGTFQRSDRLAVFDQDVRTLGPDETLFEAMQRLHPGLPPEEARATLARFGFRNVAADKPASALSGGERMRAGLAIALGGEDAPDLLLLDEPTNHLDLDAISQLEEALRGYPGALLVVSHDQVFLDNIGVTRAVLLQDGVLRDLP
ncbi:ABC-F family ATP-binding cassette domain-containing protein [Thalassococcus sp. S3]|uniref:ABC-F family ATP-binding cassette domain-containing protein n=1 Tax=Thalassococcus sp. S3 TaxID=2017482 RepID=UPI0010241EFA|nr:ABC-F family ATP-binding cassette domain-containing protein [Thalassococcus sp. S3]QBF30336.1 ABC transporter [Thalassococcus sp. S3]